MALLIALEAVFPPIPSEVILPLSGSLSAQGEFNVFLMIAAATLGSPAEKKIFIVWALPCAARYEFCESRIIRRCRV